jgi:hypothetical protein
VRRRERSEKGTEWRWKPVWLEAFIHEAGRISLVSEVVGCGVPGTCSVFSGYERPSSIPRLRDALNTPIYLTIRGQTREKQD